MNKIVFANGGRLHVSIMCHILMSPLNVHTCARFRITAPQARLLTRGCSLTATPSQERGTMATLVGPVCTNVPTLLGYVSIQDTW